MNTAQFLSTLPIMGYGMLGIFIVTGVIILSIVILNRQTQKKKNSAE